jgi:CHAT domain-containing protein
VDVEPSQEHARLRDRADAAVGSGAADAQVATSEAVRWCRDHLPADDPELAGALVRHAYALSRTGRQIAEVDGRTAYDFVFCFEEALAILRGVFGPRSEVVAATLSSFVDCLRPWDSSALAAPLRERLDILRTLRNPFHPDVAVAEYQLAQALHLSGQGGAAVAHYRASLDVWVHHPASAWAALAWSGLGAQAETDGDLDAADRAYRQAVRVTRALPGQHGPELARHLLAVARIAARRDAPDVVVPLYEEALTVQRAVFGDANPDVAATWFSISLVTSGARSLEASREALRSAGAWLDAGVAVVPADPGQHRADPVAVLSGYADRYIALLLAAGSDPAEAVGVAAWRRRLPDLVRHPWSLSPAPHPDRRELSVVLSEIATRDQERFSTTTEADRDISAPGSAWIGHGLRLRELDTRRAEVEARLRSGVVPGEVADPLASGALTRARQALADGEWFVDLGRVAGRYVALLLGPAGAQAAAVDLGSAAQIDEVALRARSAMGPDRAVAFRDAAGVRDATAPGGSGADAGAPEELARLVVEPLLPHLAGCRRMRLALDGQLLHVPIGALPVGPDGAPLLATVVVDYLTTMDELAAGERVNAELQPQPDLQPDLRSNVVLAAPNFDLGRSGSANPKSLFRPLGGTAVEADSILEILGILEPRASTISLTGDHALKTRLRDLRSPRVLHLATHGYALVGEQQADLDRTQQDLGREKRTQFDSRYQNLRREPDLRSGLALAGANTWLEHGDPGPAAETGLLTVADVIGLDLTGTELVVLSACDTGVGEIDAADGHASLRAAFLRAGAGAVVASLWKAPDASTCIFMIRFYELLGQGHGPADALRTVQLERHAAGDPVLTWGAFVCYSATAAGDADQQ